MFVKPNDTIALILLGTALIATLSAILFCCQFRPSKFFPTTTTTTKTSQSAPSSSVSYDYTDEYTMSSARLPVDYQGHVQDLSPHDDGRSVKVGAGPDGRGYSYVTSASSASSECMLGALEVEEGGRDATDGSVSSGREGG